MLHHEVDRRRCIQHLVQGDDVGVSDPFEDFDFAADSLHVRDGLNSALLQDLSRRAQPTSRKTATSNPYTWYLVYIITQRLSMWMSLRLTWLLRDLHLNPSNHAVDTIDEGSIDLHY